MTTLVPKPRRRVNTDPIGPYLDGLSLIRLGLRDPEAVEDSRDDVPGLAEAFLPFRQRLAASVNRAATSGCSLVASCC